jgi:hypothetical protein
MEQPSHTGTRPTQDTQLRKSRTKSRAPSQPSASRWLGPFRRWALWRLHRSAIQPSAGARASCAWLLPPSPSRSIPLSPQSLNLEPPAAAVRGAEQAAAPPRRCATCALRDSALHPSARLFSSLGLRRLFSILFFAVCPSSPTAPSPCSAVRRPLRGIGCPAARLPSSPPWKPKNRMAYGNFDNELAHELIESDRVIKRAEPNSFSSSLS